MKSALFLTVLLAGCAKSEPVEAPASAPADVVEPFYELLSNPTAPDVQERVEDLMVEDWVSLPTPPGGPGRDGFVATLQAFGQLMPDLEWSVVETIPVGDAVFVRGRATATPQGPFLGIEPTGRSFEIMSQDLHRVRDGKLVSVYHYEDWSSAIAQLNGDAVPPLDEDEGTWGWDVSPADARDIAQQFYDALSNPTSTTLDEDTAEFMTDDWHSTPEPPGGNGRQGFLASLGFFGQAVPDLSWEVEEMLVSDNRVIVRGVATGTPVAPFLGVEPTGRSFEVGSLDVHTLADGKIVRTFHLEDWTTAVAQLTGAR